MLPVSDVIPSRTTPWVTIALIAISTGTFLYQALLSPGHASALHYTYALVPDAPVWPAATSGLFLHVGWIHVLTNMICLWIFGENVEDLVGHAAFLAFYLITGTLGVIAAAAIDPTFMTPLTGAGPAVAAVMGAYFVLYPGSQVLVLVHLVVHHDVVEVPAAFLLGLWAVSELFTHLAPVNSPLGDTVTALVPHVTGFAIGAVAGGVFRVRVRPGSTRFD